MLNWLNSLKLATRVVVVTAAILVVVVAVNYVVVVARYRASAEDAMVEKARAFTAVADEAKNHTSTLHSTKAFRTTNWPPNSPRTWPPGNPSTRAGSSRPSRWWRVGQLRARPPKREHIDFKIAAFDARNTKNTPKPGLLRGEAAAPAVRAFEQRRGRRPGLRHRSGQRQAALHARHPPERELHDVSRGPRWARTTSTRTARTRPGTSWKPGNRARCTGPTTSVMPMDPVNAQVQSFIGRGLMWTLPLALCALFGFIYIVRSSVGQPVSVLTTRTGEVAKGDLKHDVPTELRARKDEVGDLRPRAADDDREPPHAAAGSVLGRRDARLVVLVAVDRLVRDHLGDAGDGRPGGDGRGGGRGVQREHRVGGHRHGSRGAEPHVRRGRDRGDERDHRRGGAERGARPEHQRGSDDAGADGRRNDARPGRGRPGDRQGHRDHHGHLRRRRTCWR